MEDFETSNAEDATQRLSGFDGMPKNEAAHIKETDLFVPGNLFLGKYSIKEKIGEGGMGVVYRCSQVFISKDLAIKTLNSGSLNDEAIQRFQTEAKAAGALYHPNIVAVHDFGVTESGTPYMVMDYVPGKTLHDVLSFRGQLSLETVIDIFAQCSDALAHAHSKGVFHRDIKPSNIVLLQEESIGPGAIRILDFGIAKITSNCADSRAHQDRHCHRQPALHEPRAEHREKNRWAHRYLFAGLRTFRVPLRSAAFSGRFSNRDSHAASN